MLPPPARPSSASLMDLLGGASNGAGGSTAASFGASVRKAPVDLASQMRRIAEGTVGGGRR